MPATNSQVAPAQEAGRPQPQTTIEPPGGPFIRHSQSGRRPQYTIAGQAFGNLITQPLVAAPGYARKLRLQFQAASSTLSAASLATSGDAPYSAVSLVTLRDAFGTPLIVGPGWEIFKALPKYGGQFGLHAVSDPNNLPSFIAPGSGASGASAYQFSSVLPLEFAKAYGCISMANASLLPTLQIQMAASAAVYASAASGTAGTFTVNNELDFYWLPEGVAMEPPGLGTTCQWVLQVANPSIASAASQLVALPRLGGYLSSLTFIFRDSTNARSDLMFPTQRIRIYVDGVPLVDTLLATLQDDMQIQFAGAASAQWTRDTGVLALTRKTSMNQESLGLLDTGEEYLSTNPGTLIQVEGSPWGSFANTPGTLNAIVGQVVPAGSLIQGLPEL
ncbi:MAG: hypothetical protein ACREMY_00185 [bacterium]